MTYKYTISDIVNNNIETPLNIDVIPNNMGINLCSVASIEWERQPDGQLVSLTINLTPDNSGEYTARIDYELLTPLQEWLNTMIPEVSDIVLTIDHYSDKEAALVFEWTGVVGRTRANYPFTKKDRNNYIYVVTLIIHELVDVIPELERSTNEC